MHKGKPAEYSIGKRYGQVVVTGIRRGKNYNAIANFDCDCGKSGSTILNRLRRGNTKSCGCARIGKRRTGTNTRVSEQTLANIRYREAMFGHRPDGVEYRLWRQQVYKRDNMACRLCDRTELDGARLHAHHVQNYADYPELRYDVDNGVTLCFDCHDTASEDGFHKRYGTRGNTLEQLGEYFESKGKVFMAARRVRFYLPDGNHKDIYYEKGMDKHQIVDDLLSEWSELCEQNWLNSNHKDKGNAEGLVKRFMQSLSDFLMKDTDEGENEEHPVMTDWAHRKARSSEVLLPGDPREQELPVPGVDEQAMQEIQEGKFREAFGHKKKNKTKKRLNQPWVGKFNRLMRYRYKDPDCQVESFPIDTENVFTAYGVTYRMDESVQQYAPRMGRGGEPVYDMDRVLVAKMTDGALHFMDLNAWEIPAEMISTV